MELEVIKKDGTHEGWDWDKIEVAINKASQRANWNIREADRDLLESYITFECESKHRDIPTSEMHNIVIKALHECGYKAVSDAYKEFRDYKNTYAKAFEAVKDEADTVLLLGDKENANFDSSLVSTKGSLIKGYLTKQLYKQFYLTKEEKEATKVGKYYIHDLRDMIFGSINCCLFDMATVLKGGFSMSNVTYTEPTSVLSALQVIGDITLVATAQQFGGFTIPQIDKTLLPYAKKTYDHAFKKYFDQCNMEFDEACAMAVQDLKRELGQGFQSLELKLNTVPCSRGDFAFTTLTFGEWSNDLPEYDKEFLELICETILETRMKGHGGKQVVFPKLVYLYDWEQHGSDEHANVFEKAVECSSKCMYPDFLAINAPHGTVSETYRASNKQCVIHPMGCRAYLTPWKDPETDEYVSVGRCNIGAVSLNLPLIYKSSKGNFWEELMVNLEQIRGFLKRRYDMIKHAKASTNPMAFCQGGFYKGFLKPEDEVGELTKYMTASFGISALNEFAILFTGGKDLQTPEGQKAAKDVVKFIYDAVQKFKKEDGYLYALYGTPAESLCGTQMTQYHEYCAKNNLKDEFEGRAYFTNSFHIHVSADITPFEKQDLEFELFHLIEGGHIQYVRIDNPENKLALINTILRGMAHGFYQGVNFDAAYCEDCHQHSFNVGNTCPYCGSSNLSVISRVCGYLGYSNINGNSRMNDAKMAEINDRKSM